MHCKWFNMSKKNHTLFFIAVAVDANCGELALAKAGLKVWLMLKLKLNTVEVFVSELFVTVLGKEAVFGEKLLLAMLLIPEMFIKELSRSLMFFEVDLPLQPCDAMLLFDALFTFDIILFDFVSAVCVLAAVRQKW